MLNPTGWLYRLLLAVLHWLGGGHAHTNVHTVDDATRQAFGGSPSFTEVDHRATQLGEAYRGVGVLVAAMGTVTVFLALAPAALGCDEHLAHRIEFGLLIAMGAVVGLARRRDWKGRWIRTRLLAEELRYEPLRLALQALEKQGVSSGVRAELQALLCGGPNCQISYNRSKQQRYERIESAVVRCTWGAFFVAMLCALASLLPTEPKGPSEPHAWKQALLLGTALVPFMALVLHSLMGFFRLPQLSDQHERTVVELQKLQKSLPAADADDEFARALLLGTGNAVYQLLRRGDTAWTGIAGMQEVHPA